MARLKWRDFGDGLWVVGPPETNPPSTLRRAKGVAPLRTRALRSRSGTLEFFAVSAHSMTRYNGTYIMGVGTQLYTGTSIGSEAAIASTSVFDGSRLTFVQMPPTSTALVDGAGKQDYLFMAGGGELRKLNPDLDDLTEWGIAPPDISSTTATVVAQITNHEDDLDDINDGTTDWADPDSASPVYTLQNDAKNQYLEGSGSMRFQQITKDSTARADRAISPVEDWTDGGGGGGAGSSPLEDFVAFDVRVQRPKNVKSIDIVFDVETDGSIAAFGGRTFHREMRVQTVRKKRKRRLIGTGDIIKKKDERKFLKDKKDLPRDRSTQEFIAEDTIGVARRRWTRVTIPKATFEATGDADPDTDWATVRGIRFEVETNKQGASNVNFDNLRLAGGVGMQGDYQYNFTYLNSTTGTRSNPDLENVVTVKDVERQAVTLSMVPYSSDGQVDKVEVWRTMGNGEIFFKEQEQDNTDAGGGVLANFTSNVADYIGMFEEAAVTLDPDLELPLDNIKPEDTYEDAVGPHVGRMWWTRDSATGGRGRVYYSPVGRAEAVAGFIDISSEEDTTQKLAIWNQQLYCFTQRNVLRVEGTDEPFTFTEVWGAPGTSQPFSVSVAPEGIYYFAQDGVRLFDGLRSIIVGAGDPLAPIWRGADTDGLQDMTGQFGLYGRGEYYVSDPTVVSGESLKTTLAVNEMGKWRDLGFASTLLFYDVKARILFALPQLGTVGDVLTIRTETHASTITISNFLSFGNPARVESTHDAAAISSPRAMTLTYLGANLATALTGGQTASLRFNVKGTTNTSISLDYTSADSTGVAKSATGSISILPEDTLSIEVVLGGGAASLSVSSVAVRMLVPLE